MGDQNCEHTVRRGPTSVRGGFALVEEPCGAPATVESGQTLCPQHRLRDDQQTFGTEVVDIAGIRQTYGIAASVPTLKRYYPGEKLLGPPDSKVPGWQDARVEILAFPLSEGDRFPIAHPWIYTEFPNIGACIVAHWRLRHPGKPGILDVSWDRRRRRDERFRRSVIVHGVGVAPEDVARLWGLWTTETEGALLVRRRGRPSNVSKPHPVRVALARGAWAIHQREPLISWDQIAARLSTKYVGRTLQRWCEQDRLHKR